MDQNTYDPQPQCRTWSFEEIPVLTACWSDLKLPHAAPRVVRHIQRFYQMQRRSFLRYCEGWLYPQAIDALAAAQETSAPLPQIQAELRSCVCFQAGGIWSLYSEIRESGLGRTQLRRTGDTWDLESGYLLPLGRFLPGGRRELIPRTAAELERRDSAGAVRLQEHWRRNVRRCFDSRRFYLSEEGLNWFYPAGVLTTAGLTTLTLPYGEAGLLRPGGEAAAPEAVPPAGIPE